MSQTPLKLLVVFIILIINVTIVRSQHYTLSGYVKDMASGEVLIGANVYDSISLKGTIANNYGFYSIKLPYGKHTVVFSFVGYQTIYYSLNIQKDEQHSPELTSGEMLKEVIISAQAQEAIEGTQMSTHTIQLMELKKMPALLGEVDILKSIQKLPGIDGGTEASSGIFVRGGDPGQNLILLDGVPVYNVNHLFGFFSVFNNDAINNVDVIKGGFPARHGGRLSSVIDIRMKEGNMKDFDIEGSVGILSSKLTISGPIVKDKTSFLLSGRRSYLDIFTRLAGRAADIGTFGFWFGDLNAKINHVFSEKDRLYFSTYLGKDKLFVRTDWSDSYSKEEFEVALEWGNITSALRWNHIFSGNLFCNTTVTYSRYRFGNGISVDYKDKYDGEFYKYSQDYKSGVEDMAINVDFDYYPTTNHHIKFGSAYINHTYTPGINVVKSSGSDMDDFNQKKGTGDFLSNEFALYAEDTWDIHESVKANIGARYSNYAVKSKFYQSLEPRASVRLKLSSDLALKGSIAYMKQYIHLLSNSSITLPTDLWVPATDNLKPQESWQYALGANYLFKDGYKLSIEGYYKTMNNVITYKEGTSFTPGDSDWQTKIANGKGWSYGAEFMGEKKWNKFNAALAYTLSWTYRQFEEINNGEAYPFKYDRRHALNFSFTYNITDRIDAGVNWMYSTGSAFTVPYEKHQVIPNPFEDNDYNQDVTYFESRNNYRAPAYHRLDAGINFHKEKKWGVRTWSFSMFNAYGRHNPVFMYINTNYRGDMELTQVTLLRFIPSFTYSFKFN